MVPSLCLAAVYEYHLHYDLSLSPCTSHVVLKPSGSNGTIGVSLPKCSDEEPALLTMFERAGKMGVHFSVDSSGILKVDKAESVIEVWEEYEVEVPVNATKEAASAKDNVTIEAREVLENDDADDSQVTSLMDMAEPALVRQRLQTTADRLAVLLSMAVQTDDLLTQYLMY